MAQERAADRPVARRPGGNKGHHRHVRLSNGMRLASLVRPPSAQRCDRRRPVARSRRGHHRQDGDDRVRLFQSRQTRNPHDPERTPGGSSSGSAAAVAADMVPIALGSQTNGSIIRPGAFCGVFAMKPTHGLVPRTGVLPLSRTLDHVGPFARSIDDLALALDVIAGYDPRSRHASDRPPAATARSRPKIFRCRLGSHSCRRRSGTRLTPRRMKLLRGLAEELGEACFKFDLPDRYAAAWDAQRVIMATEMAHNLGRLVDKSGDRSARQCVT